MKLPFHQGQKSVPARGPRRWWASVAVVVLSLFLLVPPVAFALQQLLADAPSPATGHAAVIAQGVAPMPAARVAWRVVLDTAELADAAQPEDRAVGFAVADRAAIGNFDQTTAAETRIAAGEAMFVTDGATQTRWSLGATDTSYFRIALAPEGQEADAGGDRLVYSSQPFDAPIGRAFDIDLVRDVLSPDEESRMTASGTPILILVTTGSIEVQIGTDQPVTLAAGQAGSFTGSARIFGAGSRSSSFVAAVIGPEMPEPPTGVTGSIDLTARACPAELDPADAASAGWDAGAMAVCTPLALPTQPSILLADGSPLAPGSSDPATATYSWFGLLPSPFPMAIPALPSPYEDWVVVDSGGVVVASSEASGVLSGSAVPGSFQVDREDPELTATLYLFAAGEGQIDMQAFRCNAGTNETNAGPERCTRPADTISASLVDVETGVATDLGAAPAPGQPRGWTGLDLGDYQVSLTALPTGYDRAAATGATYDQASGQFRVTLTEQTPTATVQFFLLPDGSVIDGAVSVRVYDCPEGMNQGNLVGDACGAGDGSNLLLTGPDGEPRGTIDATVNGNAWVWDELGAGRYLVQDVSANDQFRDRFVSGAADLGNGQFTVDLSETTPVADIQVYRFSGQSTNGSVTVRVYDCPPGMTRDSLAPADCTGDDPAGVVLSPDAGANAPEPGTVAGNGVTWTTESPAQYTVQVPAGPGITDTVAPGYSDLGAGQFGVPTSAENSAVTVEVFRLSLGNTGQLDSDGDGLSDTDEAARGSNPSAADTDSDGRADGDEIADRRFVTDPLNPDTDGDGVNDGDEFAAGTDPTDANSR